MEGLRKSHPQQKKPPAGGRGGEQGRGGEGRGGEGRGAGEGRGRGGGGEGGGEGREEGRGGCNCALQGNGYYNAYYIQGKRKRAYKSRSSIGICLSGACMDSIVIWCSHGRRKLPKEGYDQTRTSVYGRGE